MLREAVRIVMPYVAIGMFPRFVNSQLNAQANEGKTIHYTILRHSTILRLKNITHSGIGKMGLVLSATLHPKSGSGLTTTT